MKDLIKRLQENKQYKGIMRGLQAGKDCSVNGLWGSSANFFIAAIADERLKSSKGRPKALVVVPILRNLMKILET